MATIHQYDERGIYTGVSIERDTVLYGLPFRYSHADLPALEEGQYARLNGDAWEIVNEDPALPLLEEQHTQACNDYLNTVRSLREQILNRLAGIGLAAFVAGDQPTVDAVLTARQRLLDITKIPDALAAYAARDLAAMELAVKTEYAAIVASVPPSLVNAFDEIDQ
jgi:hypothetical protein